MAEDVRLGTIEVTPTAIAAIASEATMRCYGVVGMAGATLRDGLAELLSREKHRHGAEIRLDKGQIVVDVYVILEHGVRISEVAHNIMESVSFVVQKTLGMPVSTVNVHVQGLRIS